MFVLLNCFADWHENGIVRYCDAIARCGKKVLRADIVSSADTDGFASNQSDSHIRVLTGKDFPGTILHAALTEMLMRRLRDEKHVLVLCNRPYMMDIANIIRTNIHCKVAMVLHYMPEMDECNILKKHFMPDFVSHHDILPFRQADVVVALCEAGLEWLQKRGLGGKSVLIRNGVPTPDIKARRKPGAVFKFLFPGGTVRHKGFEKIMPAIRKVAEKRRIEIVVIGNNEFKLPDAADLPIKFTGFVADGGEIQRLYSESDCVLFASAAEACSFATIDAMSFGLPIISTDVAGQREMLGGGCAQMVKMNSDLTIDADEYAAAMMRVIDDPALRMRMSASSRARHLSRHTERRMLKKHARLFKKLIGGD